MKCMKNLWQKYQLHRFTLSKFFGLFGCISSIMHGRRPRRLSSAHRCVWTRSCPVKFGIQTEKTIQICGTIYNWNIFQNLTNNQIMTFILFCLLVYSFWIYGHPERELFFQKSQTFELGRGEQKILFGKKVTGITICIMAISEFFWDFDFTRYSKNIRILQNKFKKILKTQKGPCPT